MFKFLEYFARFQAFRGRWGAVPAWGRGVLLILALPGFVAIALSIVALVVSILALLLLTVPVYRVIRWLNGDESAVFETQSSVGPVVIETVRDGDDGGRVEVIQSAASRAPRRHVDVKIIE